jgi:hypothetical protein
MRSLQLPRCRSARRLIVETDNFIEAGTTPDPNPPLRVGFTGQARTAPTAGASLRRRPRNSTGTSRT